MAREAGPVCHDIAPDRPTCHCDLPPNHGGNLHWNFGGTVDNSLPHFWPVLGAEIPIKTFVNAETQCPACKTVYRIEPANVADSVIVIHEAERAKLPKVIEMSKGGPTVG